MKTPKDDGDAEPKKGSPPGIKAVTLRMPEADFERLRLYAFQAKRKHQDVIFEALRAFLDGKMS